MLGDALIIGLSRNAKCTIAVCMDTVFLVLAMWAAFALRLGEWWPGQIMQAWWLFVAAPLVALPVFYTHGLYRTVLRYIGNRAFYFIVQATMLHVLLLATISVALVGFEGTSASGLIIYWLLSMILVVGSRIFVRGLFQWAEGLKHTRTPVVIYGAGQAGAELARSLHGEREFLPVAFIDDKSLLHGREVGGLKVFSSTSLGALIKRYGVKQVLLAIPAAPRARRREVLRFLEQLPVQVRTVPSLRDLLAGKYTLQDVQEIDIEDLLGREPVPPNETLLSACIADKSVMITGAGGSIGSQLARQLLHLRPSRLVLFEVNEYALYQIEQELREYSANACESEKENIEILPILGSVTDRRRLESVLKSLGVQTVYHAAAYKHVPLVEHNPVEGVRNNVFGTQCAARAAIKTKVETFILVSTDKAVRPTNFMGAAKRMAELVVQGYARQSEVTRFSIVRFGNVLGSSGSVVPLFREQIRRGGPITVTHPAIIRYFMTTTEAAELVIQAGSMGRRGDVFVLDMGEPVRIADLARRMINLTGLKLRDADNPDGDIAIEFTGLRPGEKLYEETLLGNDVVRTEHPRIMRAQEADLPWARLVDLLKQLQTACMKCDSEAVRKLLKDAITEYRPQCEIQDPVWLAATKSCADTTLSLVTPIPIKARST